MQWRYVQSGAMDPAMNMAVDEAILTAHSEGKVPPTLRFYAWEPASLSIGYFQKAEEEVDFAELNRRGIGFVRRPTGGRAVLHDQELTYSLIVSEDYPDMPRGVTEAYRVLSEGLLLGFRRLGLQAEMVNLASEAEKAKYAAAAGSAVCFDSPSWYELVVEGRKVAGSAQTRQKGVVLQHGSILLDLDVDALFDVLKFPSERIKERMKRSFPEKAVAINELLRAANREAVTLPAVEAAFHEGFAEAMKVELVPGELTADERKLAAQLAEEKYSDLAYSFRR
ncbi:lipoate--protein ligase family protein [Xylanibacillus composti]|nr:biotin/lipoate A/B protein ligase family protein [Xylanibacillus composti]MDT9725017.1 lipoate--protein ligase family protein [Xylanibacillus composti]